jgi:hypothetical protein
MLQSTAMSSMDNAPRSILTITQIIRPSAAATVTLTISSHPPRPFDPCDLEQSSYASPI